MREAFALFDADKSGSIDLRELKAAMRALGFDASRDDLRSALQQIGKDTAPQSAASVTVTLDEFTSLMASRMPARDSREEVEKVFRLFDEDGSGFITFRSLKKVCAELGEGLTEDEMQDMIDEADRDQDGKISFDEFFRVMKKRSQHKAPAHITSALAQGSSIAAAVPPLTAVPSGCATVVLQGKRPARRLVVGRGLSSCTLCIALYVPVQR